MSYKICTNVYYIKVIKKDTFSPRKVASNKNLLIKNNYDSEFFFRQSMKKWFGQLHDINRDLVSGYKIR